MPVLRIGASLTLFVSVPPVAEPPTETSLRTGRAAWPIELTLSCVTPAALANPNAPIKRSA